MSRKYIRFAICAVVLASYWPFVLAGEIHSFESEQALTIEQTYCAQLVPEEIGRDPSNELKSSEQNTRTLNINFGREPFEKAVESVIGEDEDHWNLIDVGQRQIDNVIFADGSSSDIEVSLSENDGEWGIVGHRGVYHAYLYHNCRCVDLQLTLRYLPAGRYYAFVYAHGDAPDQNAAIEIQSGDRLYKGKKTLNDGTLNFRNQELTEGDQYVKYSILVKNDAPVVITAKRDGSNLSMLNAVQLIRLEDKAN